MGKYSALEQVRRAETLEHMTRAMMIADRGINHTEFEDGGDTVAIHYHTGYIRRVNVALDSPMEIIKDLAEHGF